MIKLAHLHKLTAKNDIPIFILTNCMVKAAKCPVNSPFESSKLGNTTKTEQPNVALDLRNCLGGVIIEE